VCDPARGPSLHLLLCSQCGAETEAFSDEVRVCCEGCGAVLENPHYHVHTP